MIYIWLFFVFIWLGVYKVYKANWLRWDTAFSMHKYDVVIIQIIGMQFLGGTVTCFNGFWQWFVGRPFMTHRITNQTNTNTDIYYYNYRNVTHWHFQFYVLFHSKGNHTKIASGKIKINSRHFLWCLIFMLFNRDNKRYLPLLCGEVAPWQQQKNPLTLGVCLNLKDVHERAHTYLLRYTRITIGEHNEHFSLHSFFFSFLQSIINLDILKSNGNWALAHYNDRYWHHCRSLMFCLRFSPSTRKPENLTTFFITQGFKV